MEIRSAFTLPDINDRRHQPENPALGRTPAKPCQDMQRISKWLFFSRRNLNGKLQSPPYLMVLMVFTTGGERFYLDKSKCQPSMEHLMFVSLIKEGFFSDTW